MADVRLTATNPADSSVVPVACNEKGELKLEEIPDQSFDGNLDGDLTVSGTATFGGDVSTNGLASSNRVAIARESGLADALFIRTNNSGTLQNRMVIKSNGTLRLGAGAVANPGDDLSTNKSIELSNDGSATFADGNIAFYSNGSSILYRSTSEEGNNLITLRSDVGGTKRTVVQFLSSGSATFAGNKAGFTAEGYLWCTTRRGDTVMLDVTSNGLASWVPYTPPTRLTELQDQWAEKDGILPVPHESSQDEPEIPQ